jgi:hypothetical protein
MRRIALLAIVLAAGCTPTPDVQAPSLPPSRPSPIVTPVPQQRGGLIGLTAAELVERLGSPALQIREGQSLKLQFRGASCILDAYLYRPAGGQGIERVAHVDTRLRSGADSNQGACIAALGPR